METQGQNPAVSQQAGSKSKIQNTPFRPKATLLVDVLPANSGIKARAAGADEGMLRELVMNTEASALLMRESKIKWQFATLILAILVLGCCILTGWLYIQNNSSGVQKAKLTAENQSLNEKLNTAGTQITGLKGELETLLNRNLELAGENAQLKSLKNKAAPPAQQQPADAQPGQQTFNAERIDAIRKGTYPNGATKEELIAALGEPDRVYKGRGYEQLVYFDKKPGKFWFGDKWLVRATE